MVFKKLINLFIFITLNSQNFEYKREIITFERPIIILESPLLNSLKVFKDTFKIPFKLKSDTLFPLLPLTEKDTFFVEYLSFFYKKDTTVLKIKSFLLEEEYSEEKKKSMEEEMNVEIKGEKTLSASYSGYGFKIDQRLNFEIDGELSKGYRVRGKISDESFPEEENFTRNLTELEEASFNFEGENLKAKIGEFTMKSNFYPKFSKEILGLEFNAYGNKNNFTLILGYPKGKFKTLYIELDKSNLNNFLLIDPLKEKIVPNSERVYLDGRLLKRGREFDYIIDYSNGTLTLTQNVSYSLNSKLRLDFEIVEDAYSNYIFSSEYQRTFALMNLNFMYINESDIASMPKFLLKEEDKENLKNVEDSSWVLLNGINLVDSGKGDYILKSDTLIYVGKNKGNVLPNFVFVGPFEGDYEFVDGKNYFVYVGEGKGSYKPGKWGITPKRNQNLIFSLKSENNFLKIDNTFGFSLFNPNLFIRKNISGFYGDFRFNVEKGKFGIDFNFLGKKNFKSPFRIFEENYFYYWGKNIKGNFYDTRIKPYLKLNEIFNLYYTYSNLKSENFFIDKNSYGYEFNYFFKNKTDIEFFSYRKNSWKRFNLYFEKKWILSPFYNYFYEIDTLKIKKINESFGFKIDFKNKSFLYEIISFRRKSLRELKNNFRILYSFDKLNLKLSSSLINLKDSIISKRDFNYYLEANFYPRNNLSLNFVSNLIRMNGLRRVFEYVKVPEGRGSYSYDSLSNTFYPDPDGSYIRKIRDIPLNEGILKSENDFSFNFNGEKFFYITSVSYRRDKSFEPRTYFSLIKNLNFNIFLSPFLNFIYIRDFNRIFEGFNRNESYEILTGIKKTYFKKILEISINFKRDIFEELFIFNRKKTYALPFSIVISESNINSKIKLSPGLVILEYFRPESDRERIPFLEFNFNLSSIFIFKTKIFFDFNFIIKKSYKRSFASSFERDNWRYNFSFKVERNITSNTIVILRSDLRRGSFSKSFYNFYLETKLLF